jgi:RNA polymerase primary sigma factor
MSTRAALRPGYAPGIGVYLHDIDRAALLSPQQEREQAERIAQGDPQARDRLVRANLRLVVHIARGYLGRGLPLEDLIAEGNLGLMRAVESYDGQAGVRFSTYGSFWIKQSIRMALIKQGKPIRLPHHMVTLLAKWRRASARLDERLGRAPTFEEVGQTLGLSSKKQAMALRALEVIRLTGCLDDHDAAEEPPLARVVDRRGKAAEDVLLEADTMERIVAALGRLPEREATILRKRFGLEGESPMTLLEVSRLVGLTRERVRQIEKEAIERLAVELDDSGGVEKDNRLSRVGRVAAAGVSP